MFRDKNTEKLIFILFLFSSVIPFISNIFGIEMGIRFPVSSVYVFYMLLGFSLSKRDIPPIGWWGYLIISFIVSLCCVDSYCYIYDKSVIGFAKYGSPFISVFAATVFVIFKNVKFKSRKVMDKVVISLSKYSFCMYVIHMFWINVLYKVIKLNPNKIVMPYLGIVVVF